jgi:hypothetical protein
MNRLPAALVILLTVTAAHAAAERVTPFIEKPEGAVWRDGYTHVQGGEKLTLQQGGLPVVQHEGRPAVKIEAIHVPGGSFQIGLVRKGWSRYYLDDYGPNATLDIDLAGSVSGEFRIELVDMDRDGGGPDVSRTAGVELTKYAQLGPKWQRVSIPLGDFIKARPDLRLESMEKIVVAGSGQAGKTTLFIGGLAIRTTNPEREYPPVKVDQVGYRPDWRKVALVTPPAALGGDAKFTVADLNTGKTVLTGSLKQVSEKDEVSGDRIYAADFSALTAPGQYRVQVEGLGDSAPFKIAADVFQKPFDDVFRFYFFQRCGTALDAAQAGEFAHPPCHMADASVDDPRGGKRDASGGWHDAGDMNRYAGWTIHAAGFPMLLYQHFPERFTDGQFNIPESGNGVPDILDEVKYELQWTRKMLIREGPDAGRVYDRIHESGVEQPAGVSFYDTRRKLVEPTDESSCSFIANMAQASIIYRGIPQERAFADECLADALLAWEKLQKVGKAEMPPYFTAAAMMFEATGRADAHEAVKRLAEQIVKDWHGHVNYRNYDIGLATYCLSERKDVDKPTQQALREFYRQWADLAVEAAKSRGYGEAMMPGVEFTWGSNALIAKSGAHLLMVNRFAPSQAYVQTAQDALHWLLGRNPVSQCMVTGHGTPVLRPIFHSMFGPLGPGLPMPPGYLAGGVNRFDGSGISAYQAKCWRPDHTCWQITECSIGYQGPLVYLMGALVGDTKAP